ncbi:hypothetical protein SAMN05421780_10618 [Flexibacter flexilis DSM 6793]|uniref:UbiA prenyltransferase family protein n=1 Tax=Flexibacter flexilis DSM 6793 TaxID=927664 RepID=A0A1I1JPU9_9BACT|nr:hypothetical protein [Flexibacter flexilis]SFC48568.1 hypothetical protein SAMN05421780_10618 [Flexibacter flexilis DSM 6793]
MSLLKILQYLNFDVVLGAILSLLMVQHLSDVLPQLSVSVCLALAVFVVYSTDRLLDVFGNKESDILTTRHRFYFKHFGGLALLTAQAIWVGGVVAWQSLPNTVWIFGLRLSAAVVAYLLLVQILPKPIKIYFPKEVLTAFVYCAGIWGSVKAQGAQTSMAWYWAASVFGLIALLNLLLFTYYEYDRDLKQQQAALFHRWGKKKIKLIFNVLAVIILLSVVMLMWQKHTPHIWLWVEMTEMAMALWLVLVMYQPKLFRRASRYRFAADAVFLFPAWVLFLN